jgi:uncharacterized protein YbjT (DUF2867 family)
LGENNVVVGTRKLDEQKKLLMEAGAKDVVELDLSKPETIKSAMKGCERALLVSGIPVPDIADMITFAKNFVGAAKETKGLKLIARVSAFGADPAGKSIPKYQGEADEMFIKSGLDYILFRPTFFINNLINPGNVARGQVTSASGNGKTTWNCIEDIGEVVGRVLANPKRYGMNRDFVLTGGVPLTDAELIGMANKVLGTAIKHDNVTVPEFTEMMKNKGLPAQAAEDFAYFETIKLNNICSGTTNTVEMITGHPPLTPEQWIQMHSKELTTSPA